MWKVRRDLLEAATADREREWILRDFWGMINRNWWHGEWRESLRKPSYDWRRHYLSMGNMGETAGSWWGLVFTETVSSEQAGTSQHQATFEGTIVGTTDLGTEPIFSFALMAKGCRAHLSILVHLSPGDLDTLVTSLCLGFSIFNPIVMFLGRDLWANAYKVLWEPWLKLPYKYLYEVLMNASSLQANLKREKEGEEVLCKDPLLLWWFWTDWWIKRLREERKDGAVLNSHSNASRMLFLQVWAAGSSRWT